MPEPPLRSGRVRRALPPVLLLLALVLPHSAASAAAQSLLDRPPNLGGTWVAAPGTLQFHFLHRFSVTDPPARKVVNTPTFLLAAGLPYRTMLGARYATNSVLVEGFPNEWEFFGRVNPLAEEAGAPLDVALHAGYNQPARSFDAELALARRVGPVRLLAAGRGFTEYARDGGARFALAGGASVRLHRWVSVSGDLATLLDRADEERLGWGVGVQVQIPYSPHTLSIHASSPTTTTLQGASSGTRAEASRWGFEFVVPFTPARYFGGGAAGEDDAGVEVPPGEDAVVRMTDRLGFTPRTVRIRVGQRVRWQNTSVLVHTVTADPAKALNPAHVALPAGAEPFDSGEIAPGATYTRTFTVPGTYRYFCIPHAAAGMIGTVVVRP